MFQSRNVEAGKSSSGSYQIVWHTTDKAMMEERARYRSTRYLLQNTETVDDVNLLQRIWELWYRDKSKGWRREVEPSEALQEMPEFVQGRFDGLEVEGFLRGKITVWEDKVKC